MKATKTNYLFAMIAVSLMAAIGCVSEEDASVYETGEQAAFGETVALPGSSNDGFIATRPLDAAVAGSVTKFGDVDSPAVKDLLAAADGPELPEAGNYIFEKVTVAGVAGAEVHDASATTDTWIGTLKLDSMYRYRLVAHFVSSENGYEQTIEYEGLYQARPDFIDFADKQGRALFRMDYSVYSTNDTIYLSHNNKYGQAESGDIVGIVARKL